ncbi:MAG: M14 family zinc carboxypeptidase [Bacteroidales bacterium]|nr:M14 family zinc carboxypeptidase [Bacteroidales bacterium]
MKKTALLIIMASVFCAVHAQTDYYFPGQDKFNPEIPEPSEFLGYEVGTHHARYDIMISYFKMLARKSERVNYKIIGYSEERRPQLMLIITSPANHERLEEIRLKHLALSSDGGDDLSETESVPLVIQLGFNVHGNEASGGEASLLAAYYLAASEDEEMNIILDNSVIFIEPVLNPDGRARFTSWANMNRSDPPVADPNDREHNEAWPGGRTNHYWFDLNRDWLPLSQIESRNRMEHYHSWLPNIITDHHEMGTNSTFFFEPTKKGSENPIISSENYITLNNLFAEQYADALNDIGHYYDSGRSFDNSYPGYGSSYGDLHGGLAILFEQASSRGQVQQTDFGYDLTFSLGIKNQLFAALTTVRTALDNHTMLNDYMQRFYKDALDEAKDDPVKAYIFGDDRDKNLTRHFLDLLMMHNIEVYSLRDNIRKDRKIFRAGQAYFVPTVQKQYKMIRTMFETSPYLP